MKTTKALVC